MTDNSGMNHGWTLILNAGGMRSLVATAAALAEAPRPRAVLLFVHDGRDRSATWFECVERQAEHFSIRQVIELAVPEAVIGRPGSITAQRYGLTSSDTTGEGSLPDLSPLRRMRVLMTAMAQAVEIGAERLIWPAQFDGDFESMARVSEQLVLMKHLVELEPLAAFSEVVAGPVGEDGFASGLLPPIETPLLEMSDKQVIELGGHLDVPWHLARTCTMHADKPCRVCRPCRTRLRAFEQAGMIDPVHQPVAAG